MDIQSLALFITDDCNFDCHYCYQKKGNTYIDSHTLKRAVDFFFPFLSEKCTINFYGGEPLLNFPQIRLVTESIIEKNKTKNNRIVFSITTNGSLINEKILEFMNKHSFLLLISFDGINQDISRNRGSFDPIITILKKTLLYPKIDLETNSVFTPSTIGNLSKSILSIMELGAPNISFALSQTAHWDRSSLDLLKDELEALSAILLLFYAKKGYIPVVNFRKNHRRGVFSCYAARDRMAMTADGMLWGCHLFADVFKGMEAKKEYAKFCFGDLSCFMENWEEIYPQISANYANMRMDRFYTADSRCVDCHELDECRVCPMDNRMQGPNLTEIPVWVCEQKKITRRIQKHFWRQIDFFSDSFIKKH